ncbi:MAG: AsmA-like C-terminal domain-containing protein [Alphaproteobacteria bacterium]|nr:AsmA-like C-terminal domain-containing protein [Alphaproteobacteria bacterium]
MLAHPWSKFLIGIALGLALAALVAFNAALFWVATGPRSLEKFTPYIEKALAGESDVRADISETWLVWGGWQRPVEIHLKEVSLFTKEGKKFSSFPDIALGVDVLSLPFGKVLPTSLSVTKPIISIKQNADKTLGFGADSQVAAEGENIDSTGDILASLIESLVNPRSKSSLRELHTIELLNADVSIGNDADGVIISAPDTTFVVRKESDTQITLLLRTAIKYKEYESELSGQGAYNKRAKRLEGTLSVAKLHPSVLSGLLSDNPLAGMLQLPVSGTLGFALADDGTLEALQFNLDGGRGKITHERIDGTLNVHSLKVAGKASDGLKTITIDKADIDFAGSKFTAVGTVLRAEKGLGIQGQVSITDVPAGQVRLFWPLGLSPLSREWVTGNIHGGDVTKATAIFNINPGEMELPSLPKEAVDAQLDLKDAKIRYLPDHPEVRGVNARIKVDGLSLDAAISHADALGGTVLSGGRLLIADLNPDNPLIEMSMHAEAPASDVVTLLGLPMLAHAKRLNLDAAKATGRAAADAKLSFYFFAKDQDGNDTPMTYDIRAALDKVGTPGFLGRFDIANASGDMQVNEEAIEFSGSGTVNGAALSNSKLRYSFSPENAIDTVVDATATLDGDTFKKFGVELPMEVRTLSNAALHMELSTQGEVTSLEKFSLKGEGVDVAGKALLTPDGKDLAKLTLDTFRYDKTSLSALEYEATPGGYRLNIAGPSLDIASSLEKKGDGFSFAHFPAIDLSLDIGTIYGAHGASLQAVKGRMTCTQTRCTAADIGGKIGEAKFAFGIKKEGKNRRLSATSDDAGGLLRALGIVPGMEGGTLSLTGLFDDAKGSGLLRGQLDIHDYVLKDAPVLAKMLSLASLTGIFDTLSGNGIAFKKLAAPYTLQDDVVTIQDGKAFGSAMGLTADGTITFPATTLHLEGAIVPSYTLNNVAGKVPLVGDILTGGKGEGVFAARYSMKGDSDNPNVSVNPLSILTPGFLRNLFDVF